MSLVVTCPGCTKPTPAGKLLCIHCGNKLEGVTVPVGSTGYKMAPTAPNKTKMTANRDKADMNEFARAFAPGPFFFAFPFNSVAVTPSSLFPQ